MSNTHIKEDVIEAEVREDVVLVWCKFVSLFIHYKVKQDISSTIVHSTSTTECYLPSMKAVGALNMIQVNNNFSMVYVF